MMKTFGKIVRVLTVAPMSASVLLILLFVSLPDEFSAVSLAWAMLFLVAVPLLAYGVAWLIKPIRLKGREAQRDMAMLFAVVGYVAGSIYAFAVKARDVEQTLYLTYLFSGLLTVFLNYVCKIKSSGHMCGVTGPIALLVYAVSPWYLCALPLLALVFWASLSINRHTVEQLVCGTLVPVVAMFLAIALASVI